MRTYLSSQGYCQPDRIFQRHTESRKKTKCRWKKWPSLVPWILSVTVTASWQIVAGIQSPHWHATRVQVESVCVPSPEHRYYQAPKDSFHVGMCVLCCKSFTFFKKLMTWEKFLKYSPKFNCKAGRVEGSRNGEKLNSWHAAGQEQKMSSIVIKTFHQIAGNQGGWGRGSGRGVPRGRANLKPKAPGS